MTATTRNGEYSPLERALSWQDIRDAPSLSENNNRRTSTEEHEDGYRYVHCSNRRYRNPPVHFSITLKSIDGNPQQKTCRPGSIFEGTVNIKLDSPLAAQYLKLVFKGAERIHSDAIGKSNRKKGERFFGIRTILWGLSSTENEAQWPIMEAGVHEFPFMCELPMVNYPPTFRHHLASCEFELIACLDRMGIRPFQTIPIFIRYEPLILSSPLKDPIVYQEEVIISNHIKVLVTLNDGNNINLLDTDVLQVALSIVYSNKKATTTTTTTKSIQAVDNIISHIEASIQRKVDVTHSSYHRSDTMVMSHVEQSSFVGVNNNNNIRTYYIKVPIPSEKNKNNHSAITKNFSVLGMTPTLDFSQYIKMNYSLFITAKIKNGLIISNKRQLFSIPLRFGTIAPGERIPSSITNYRDPEVTSDTTFITKPRFIKPPTVEEQLPAYDHDLSPPEYGISS